MEVETVCGGYNMKSVIEKLNDIFKRANLLASGWSPNSDNSINSTYIESETDLWKDTHEVFIGPKQLNALLSAEITPAKIRISKNNTIELGY